MNYRRIINWDGYDVKCSIYARKTKIIEIYWNSIQNMQKNLSKVLENRVLMLPVARTLAGNYKNTQYYNKKCILS